MNVNAMCSLLTLQRTALASLSAIVALLVSAGPSHAGMLFSGSSGVLSATANFSLTGNTLTVTLTNTSKADVLVPTDVLTGVLFNTTHTLTPVSASLNGSTVFYGTLTNVGDGWGYASGVSAHGKNSAISATGAVNGLGHSNFSGTSHQLQGLDYGILSAGDNPATGNTGVTGHGPLINDSVQFTLTAAPGFSLAELGNSVVFQYGTSLSETHFNGGPTPNFTAAPAPPSSVLLGIGVVALAISTLSARLRLRPAV
jgi:hypothetical protein